MNVYDFIFSDQRRYRFRRHLLFWICWCIYFAISFLVPTYWVPGWNVKGPMPQIEKYGIVIACLRILMNSVLMAVVHMGLVYGIIYFFLPRYLSKNRNWMTTTGLLMLFVMLVACINYLNFLLTFYISTRMGYFDTMRGMDFIVPIWARQIMVNYPTVVGFAIGIKYVKRWYIKQKETAELSREKVHAELQLLKAQVHPHFLFNTLNNIYSLILNGSPQGPEMIKKLSGLLRYILYECNQPVVPLPKELFMIQDYMSLEQIRYGDKLSMSIHIQGNAAGKMISPLMLLPFIENSFKHGTSRMLIYPWVRLDIEIGNDFLEFRLSNNKPQSGNNGSAKKGIGLTNVKKRLQLMYPSGHSLHIADNDMSYDVYMKLRLHASQPDDGDAVANTKNYELA